MHDDRTTAASRRLEPWQSHLVGLVLTLFTVAAVVGALLPPDPGTDGERVAPAAATTSDRVARASSVVDVQAAPPRGATTVRAADRVGSDPLIPLPTLPPIIPGTEPEPEPEEPPKDEYRPVGRRESGVGDKVRAVPARSVEGTSSEGSVRTVMTLRFNTRKGERRMVAAQVKAYQPEDTPDSILMASTSLTCSPTAEKVRSSGATQNLVRGQSTWLSTAFVYVAPRTGKVTCTVRAYGARPRPSSSGNGYNRWYVWHGSRLYLGTAQPYWAASASKRVTSRLIGRGQKTSTVSRYAAGSSGKSRTLVVADHKLTTCSSARGSRDSTTGKRELCAGHVKKTGSKVRLVVRVLQGDGRSCTAKPVVDKVYRISARMHHRNIRGQAILDPAVEKCHGTLTVSTSLVNVGGAAVMVHTTFGRTSIARG